MKTIASLTAIISITLSSLTLHAQNDSSSLPMNAPASYQNVNFNDELPYVRIGAGIWLPQGKLGEVMAPSPMFEFALDFANGHELRSVEIVMQFILPEQRRAFIYDTAAGRFTGSSNLILNGILKFKKPIYSTGANRVELGAGLGISAMFISENDLDFKDAIPYESANTILFIPGVCWYHSFKDASVLTLGTDLHIAPYTVAGAELSKLGAIAFIPKVTYRF